jgi:hypothetical protein
LFRFLAVFLLVLLAGCGDLPRPFAGNPGAAGRTLIQPPPARLIIAPPTSALLTEAAATTFARTIVDLLVEREVPAIAAPLKPGVWSVEIAATSRPGQLVPSYTVFDTTGLKKGTAEGPPVDPALWAAAAQ